MDVEFNFYPSFASEIKILKIRQRTAVTQSP